MNQNDRRILRQQAAKEIESGRTLSQVALHYGRTIKWVKDACAEYNIPIPTKGRVNIVKILRLSDSGKKVPEIAKEVGLSRQYIYSVLDRLR